MCSPYFFHFVKDQSSLKKPEANIHNLKTLASSLSHQSMWWRMTGSNRRPPACKAGALPAELIPHRNPHYLKVLRVQLAPTRLGGSGWARTNDPRLIKTVL